MDEWWWVYNQISICVVSGAITEMPRQLEIRTTILAKKPGGKGGRKDDNGNDVYADEALQLLQEIQQLKSSVETISNQVAIELSHLIFAFQHHSDAANRWKDPWHIQKVPFKAKEEAQGWANKNKDSLRRYLPFNQ